MSTGRVPTTANSPLTAKGDLFGYSTTQARVAVGSDGDTLVADSSSSTGLRWQGNYAGGKNLFINGALNVWQRGTSFTSDAVYTADRWIASMQTGQFTISQMTSSLPSAFRYGIKLQRNSGSTSTSVVSIAQVFETTASIPLQGQKLTFSFWAKKGANYSDTVAFVRMYSGTGTDQSASSYGGWTGYAEWQDAVSVTPTTSWVRYSVTGTVPSNATQVGFRIGYTGNGTAGADDSLQITGVQLEVGSVATAFQTATGTLQGELAACQRYYQVLNGSWSTYATNGLVLANYYRHQTQMRTAPTITITTAPTYTNASALTNDENTVTGSRFYATVTATGRAFATDFIYTASSEL